MNYLRNLYLGPTDPPEYNWLYSIPAAVFTGGFLLAAQTGFAGLVQAGYLTSSILCISAPHFIHLQSPNSHAISTRFPFRTWVSVYRKTRQCAWYAGRWLGFPYVLGCCWVPTGRPRAIRYVDCRRRHDRLDYWEEDYHHGTASDGCWLVTFFLRTAQEQADLCYVFIQPCTPLSVLPLSLPLLGACWWILATRQCFTYGSYWCPFLSTVR